MLRTEIRLQREEIRPHQLIDDIEVPVEAWDLDLLFILLFRIVVRIDGGEEAAVITFSVGIGKRFVGRGGDS